ncbi:MAG: peptidase, partial [Nitrosopumilales archaeon CG_4_10_14_0_8_um_filter_34_8]
MFPIGTTAVNCSVTDSYGNITEKSFLVTVEQEEFTVPTWVKNIAGYWCGEEIEDSAFIQAIQYLITTNVIVIPPTNSTSTEIQPIPSWIKNTACWWSSGTITDGDFIKGIEYLVKQGIIQV